jgi:endo-1,4-beta-D-glucanase Y
VSKSESAEAYSSNIYHNLFIELLSKSPSQVQTKLNNAWNQLFYGDNNTQRIYYTVDTDMAYIKDILHNNVCSEGMSYGMMVAVQLNKKTEFDCLWKWAKTYMQHGSGPRKNYFAWLLNTNGIIIDPNSASDGEEWLAMALFFAAARWGNGTGVYNYRAEAQTILDAMLTKETSSGNDNELANIFNKTEKQVVFAPVGTAAAFTDPSYHLPHYYELWGRWADKDNQFWFSAASASRQFFKNTAHPTTGLTPDYAKFDGTPTDFHNGGHEDFRFDAWRVAMNIAVDYAWFAKDSWAVTESNRLLDFFYAKGINTYGNQYTLDGTELSSDHSPGLAAMNAVACLASTNNNRINFVQELWNTSIPSGPERYYDGMLYMLAMLHLSGSFRIYSPAGSLK